MKIRKGDKVIVIAGKEKGKTGTIISVSPKNQTVIVEGLNMRVIHHKPSTKYPQGGITKEEGPIHVSNVAILRPNSKKLGTRVGYKLDKQGNKVRVARQANNKEIK